MTEPERRLRVLVADDSAVARRLMVHILSGDPQLKVIAEAENGEEAVRFAIRDRPDVIVMDIAMPTIDGLEATRRIMQDQPTPIVLVSASYHPDDLRKSFEALEAGALTLLAKPSGPEASSFAGDAAALTITVKLMAEVKTVRRRGTTDPELAALPDVRAATPGHRPVEIIAIAASTGGPAALAKVIGALPATTPVPVLVVQHITAGFHQALVDWLAAISPISVRLAREGERLRPGEVLVAPPDAHLGVTGGGRVALSTAPPVGGHRPSASHLFSSIAGVYGAAAAGAILTGMGEDGVTGLRALKDRGGLVLAQDEATSIVYGMPRQAVALGIVDHVLPINRIAPALIAAWNGAKR